MIWDREDVILRRMKNTGESYAEAVEALKAVDATLRAEVASGGDWVEAWLAGETDPDTTLDSVLSPTGPHWQILGDLPVTFPPLSVVRGMKNGQPSLTFPPDGAPAIVIGYAVTSAGGPSTTALILVAHPEGVTAAHADPDLVELIGHRKGASPEDVHALRNRGRS